MSSHRGGDTPSPSDLIPPPCPPWCRLVCLLSVCLSVCPLPFLGCQPSACPVCMYPRSLFFSPSPFGFPPPHNATLVCRLSTVRSQPPGRGPRTRRRARSHDMIPLLILLYTRYFTCSPSHSLSHASAEADGPRGRACISLYGVRAGY